MRSHKLPGSFDDLALSVAAGYSTTMDGVPIRVAFISDTGLIGGITCFRSRQALWSMMWWGGLDESLDEICRL